MRIIGNSNKKALIQIILNKLWKLHSPMVNGESTFVSKYINLTVERYRNFLLTYPLKKYFT